MKRTIIVEQSVETKDALMQKSLSWQPFVKLVADIMTSQLTLSGGDVSTVESVTEFKIIRTPKTKKIRVSTHRVLYDGQQFRVLNVKETDKNIVLTGATDGKFE